MTKVAYGAAIALSVLITLGSCGGGEESGGSPSGDGGGAAGAIGLDASGGSCEDDSDCSGGMVCHPYLNQCVSPGDACTGHSGCDSDTYCDETTGVCLPGTVGSPCESDENCIGTCASGVCGCAGSEHAQELVGGPLDIYFVFDRTGSMGQDCDYQAGGMPPVMSKACFATFALSDYLTGVTPQTDTRLAFQFMSLADDDCDGVPYATPLIDLTALPVGQNHAMIQAIGNETFAGGFGTHIEGALRGITDYTANNTTPGRGMVGVLMTDGDPNGCEEDIPTLSQIIADHRAATGTRTFIIGMEGATDQNLEDLGIAGGADPHDDWCGSVGPPCHYWNVADGSGDAIASALSAIIGQAAPLPCSYEVGGLPVPAGEQLDYGKVNVALTDPSGAPTTIGQVADESACPTDTPAWYYDDPTAPTTIHLCPHACDIAKSAPGGARMTVVFGCEETVVVQ